jgi:hypothetical protein
MTLKFFPYDSFTVETTSTVSLLVQTLQQHIGRRQFWYSVWGKVEQEFEGTATEKGFKVSRIINYHNSFLPIMIGRFEEGPGSTRVIVRMRLHDYTLAMMSLIFVIMVYLVVGIMESGLQSNEALLGTFGFPAVVLVVAYIMTIFGFSHEAEESRKILVNILEGRER